VTAVVPATVSLAASLLLAGCSTGHPRQAPPPTAVVNASPGAYYPAVSQQTIDQTVCVPGWTATIRPHLPTRPGYEYDHVVPLSLGGAPTDGANLQYVPLDQARKDDRVESLLHRLVCRKPPQMTLADAQALIVAWKRSYG
jgi:hypothetical protein